ncbi:MAG: GTPase [Desulfobacteraceae bacterium]|jgi:energy-coupling factor transporter ATP-binding protein EcfA2|nr:GTPase [Desulfobacteraceae bacterium]
MLSNRQTAALKAFGKIESYKNDLNLLGSTLDCLSLWMPAAALKRQCDEAVRMINSIAERFDRKLVVTIVGPCGAGKSTLLNALAGVDDLSPAGHDRPTTGHLIVFSSDRQDAEQLVTGLGSEAVEVRSSPAAAILEHVLLIDTPDTDSMAYQKHSPLVREAIARSDMLICVFDSENPKRKDHVDFLAPFIRKFSGEALVGVINKGDRQDEKELRDRILPDFAAYIQAAWQTTVDRLLCISARRHLQEPQFDESAGPKHDFDQFEDLRELIFDNLNRAGYVVDRRLENARSLRDFVFAEARREISGHRRSLVTAQEQMQEAEKKSFTDAVSAMQNDDTRQLFGVGLLVYQKLSQRWVGPLGWMIAIWARLLIFGAGMAAMFRFGRPVSQIIGMISAWRHFKESKAAVAETKNDERVGVGLRTFRLSTMGNWPDIAEALVSGGFNGAVRRVEDVLPDPGTFSDKLGEIWSNTLDSEMERMARKLSGMLLQLVLNLPMFAALGYTGWITVQRFLQGSYLALNFFVHALWTIGIILLLSFFLFQILVRLVASPERLTAKAFEKLKRQADQFDTLAANPVSAQVETLMQLDAMLASRGSE